MTPEEYSREVQNIPAAMAVTLITHYADGTSEDWHFATPREAKDFILAIQAAKTGFGEEWMTEIFRVDIRSFAHGAN
jgi:hypothetical protein